jgi:large subunit ribosomal protein L25
MEALELMADVRDVKRGQVKQIRQQGLVPAVLYGKDVDATMLQLDAKTLNKVLREAGTHQLIALKIGAQQPTMTLARDIQRDPLKHELVHVDFFAVKMTEKVSAQVPLVLKGHAPGVEKGGILTQGLDQVEIECLPADLIASIEISVEGLAEYNDTITVADLVVPDNITVLSDPDSVVAKIEPPRLEEELEAEAEAVSAEPEVLGRGKDKDEDDEE